MDTQSQAIQALTRELPLNDYGLPTGIYRADLLPYDNYLPHAANTTVTTNLLNLARDTVVEGEYVEAKSNGSRNNQSQNHQDLTLRPQDEAVPEVYRVAGFPAHELHQAFVPLQYEEGFPAFESGIPFWSRLEFEPVDAFKVFEQYLKMHQGSTSSLDEEEYAGSAASGSRSIATLVASIYPDDQINTMVQIFTGYYHTYYWGMRAHAYDLYKVAEFRKRQEMRALETQGEHYYESRRLRHRLSQYMDSDEDFWELMTPKVAIDMLKSITQLERISAGLPAGGPAGEGDGNGVRPLEVIFRNVAQEGRKETGRTLSEDGEVLDSALDDPETTRVLQELIIRGGL